MENMNNQDYVLSLVESPFFKGASFKKTNKGIQGSIILKNGMRVKEIPVR